MQIDITPQRQAYFDARGKVILNACPGSGKTTCLIYKLPILEKECLQNYGRHGGIACLSFTNVAKDEILHKYKNAYQTQLPYPHIVATIDSFINSYITLPFFNLINSNFTRPKIIEQSGQLDELLKIKYFSKGVLKEGMQWPIPKFKNTGDKPLYRSYPPSKIWIDIDGTFTFEGKTPDVANVDPIIFQEYGQAIMDIKLQKGFITSLDSAYLALKILNENPKVGNWLVQRFPYIIIDEAQDNSEIQHAIFDELIKLGLSNIEMIGDPYQSLYEWRDAKPSLFTEKYSGGNWTALPLSQNRRSVQRIIDCFSIMRTSTDPKITSIDVNDLNLPLLVYKYNTTNPAIIVDDFEQRCMSNKFVVNQIVVRGNTLKDKMLGNNTEINPWKTFYPSTLLQSIHYFETGNVKNAVTILRKFVLELQNPTMDYHQRKELLINCKFDHILNSKIYSFLYQLPESTQSLENWTITCIKILADDFAIDATETFAFKAKINGFKMALLKKQPVNMYFNKSASRTYNIPVTTIHQIKGSTLDAILYFFDEKSTGQSVSFNDFKQSATFPTEKQRIIYVACSRPQQLLALAFPAKILDSELYKKFGKEIEILTL